MFDHAINQGFMKKSHQRLWALAQTPAEALDIIANELEHEPEPFESKY
jgi:predicted Rossmann-fold nucleotide-binding protein